jgi:hypothetical protein
VLVKLPRTNILLGVHALVVDGFQIGVESSSTVWTLGFEKQLTLFYVVPQACFDVHDAAACQGDYRQLASDVGTHRARNA